MALKVVTMAELRLEVLFQAERSGESVTEVCRRHGISRQTYFRYRRPVPGRGVLEAVEPIAHVSRSTNWPGSTPTWSAV
jgi:transposase-like protein